MDGILFLPDSAKPLRQSHILILSVKTMPESMFNGPAIGVSVDRRGRIMVVLGPLFRNHEGDKERAWAARVTYSTISFSTAP